MAEHTYICLDCGATFDTPRHYTERHGLDTPPYEQWDGCPSCGGAYDMATECTECGRVIPADDGPICEECLSSKEDADHE